ncbi:hypothetical protein P154DRAFT_571251 [Amniculicola lignicola CBS 123094]|uniref:Uncharacterized protein n=1 Tax=Amniculicola lignicola CBS 123094 TaxID=1392246 RepID=A0A6A5X0V6_9PLEO|nr:hypothetical protein P154DRAFT_571251 [Amniculicola lignicola CBS 123094]
MAPKRKQAFRDSGDSEPPPPPKRGRSRPRKHPLPPPPILLLKTTRIPVAVDLPDLPKPSVRILRTL